MSHSTAYFLPDGQPDIPKIAEEMHTFLTEQEDQTCELADLVSEMRTTYDLRSAQIDDVLEHMVANDLASVWREASSGLMWISTTEAVPADAAGGGESGEAGGNQGDQGGEADEAGDGDAGVESDDSGFSWP